MENHNFMDSHNKIYLKSLIRIEDEGQDLHQYKSIREIVSSNEIHNENDFFYLSNWSYTTPNL